VLKVAEDSRAVRRLRVVHEVVLVFRQAVEPVKRTIYFGIAKSGTHKLVAQFLMVGFGFFFGVDVGLE
jgi:hypothetical protein